VLEAGIPLPAVGIEDSEGRVPPRWTEPAPPDRRVGPLAHDVTAEPDPGPARQLEPERGCLGHGAGEAGRQVGRLDDEQEGAGAASDRRDPVEPIDRRPDASAGQALAVAPPAGPEVEDGHVDGPSLEERADHRERLVERFGDEDREVGQPHTARRGLDGIERPSEVDPGRERARRLRLGDEAERERRRPARPPAAQGDRRGERHAARPEDRVERREPGRDGALVVLWDTLALGGLVGEGDHGEGAVDCGLARPRVGLVRPRVGLVRP
jgi:hypothetical protein